MAYHTKVLSLLAVGVMSLPLVASASSSAQADILSVIARCESGGRQFDARGRVLRNPSNPRAVGKYQIIEAHLPKARCMGMNIYLESGNEAFARWLFKEEGTRPWNASRHCWGRQHTALN
ncbi:MAG: hypothetical protein JWO43_152 [Candidatus Adlerbacteria bacterium]|nr:hypothetical protein [Candidatus Adlerbacteria bacterium]